MSKIFNVGLIGAGRIGKIHIENLIHHVPAANLKIISDIKINNALTQWVNQLGIPKLTEDVSEIFGDPEIDAVIIASSTDTHAKFVQQAAKAGKHIFCEKPLDMNVKRIKDIIASTKKENVKLMIGFNRRFDNNFQRVYEVVDSGQIGSPQIIKITSRDPAPPSIEYIKISGGIFIDMSIHDWDMARFLAKSEVEEVYTSGANLINPEIGKAGDIDTAVAIVKFKNKALGIIDNSRKAVYGYDQRAEVFGSKGCVLADNRPSSTIEIYTNENITKDKIPYFFLERYRDSYINELIYFFNSLKKNINPIPNGEDALQSILIAKAAQKSFNENTPVKISEIDQ
jgi:myo-inositol 2-dehydrogenase/D-chiro-inositol 1-dehydrogenase